MLRPDIVLSAALSPLQASSRTAAPATALDWHAHPHDELCLVADGTPLVGHAGGKVCADTGTLFLFTENEAHGFWNFAGAAARWWSLEFRISSGIRAEFGELFERPPQRRALKLSAGQQQRFCHTCQKIAFEKGVAGFLNATAASVLLALQLVNVTRWFSDHRQADILDGREKLDPQCFELWQKIHQHAFQPASPGPMCFGLNPGHDSLRHRFRKLFGVSPQGLLVRLRMNRSKELLLSDELSVKEIAHELGYSRQHDFTRAFHKCTGMSPSQWRMRTRQLDP
ncbi:MAG: helix-turn-helix transcriptional regulator [Verrucomicrobia bacterium]|nr:helix-turn-helix transcriptional regulator [Verrucomicrobiota bacterium]